MSAAWPLPGAIALCALLAAATAPAARGQATAQEGEAVEQFAEAAQVDLEIRFVSPRVGEAAMGAVAIEVEVTSASPVRGVELRVDGRVLGLLDRPPWRIEVDLGEDNVDRRLTATVLDAAGRSAVAEIVAPAIRVDQEMTLELRQLYASVTRLGRPVLDLERSDFEILDDGERQTIVTFERGDVPLTVAILLDTSFSMKGEHLAACLAGVRAFLDDMKELDVAKLVLFSDHTLAATPWSSEPDALLRALPAVEGVSGTTVNDHLYLALGQLEGREGRRVVVLLSDGVDVESVLQIRDVLWKAGRSRALVYWIRTRPDAARTRSFWSSWRDAGAHRAEIDGVEELVRSTGGRIFPIGEATDAPAALAAILHELRSQYVFGYYPTENRDDGRWRQVVVKERRGAEVRTRRGYYDTP